MKTITIQYNIDNQFGGCDLENNEQETESAQALYKAACELMAVNNDGYTFTPDAFVGSHPAAPNVWSIEENIEQGEEWIRDELQRTLEDVMSQGDFWVISKSDLPMRYTQKSNKPEWYNSDDSKLYYSATSGSSPFNEWYEFSDEKQAVDYIRVNFTSQSFLDHMVIHEEEIYYDEDLKWNDDGEIEDIANGAIKNDLQAAVDFESRF